MPSDWSTVEASETSKNAPLITRTAYLTHPPHSCGPLPRTPVHMLAVAAELGLRHAGCWPRAWRAEKRGEERRADEETGTPAAAAGRVYTGEAYY